MPAHAEPAGLEPVVERLIDDCETPVSAFLKLRTAFEGPAFLLESAEQGRLGRYSYLGFKPHRMLRWSLGDEGDPYELAETLIGETPVKAFDESHPFNGGAVGIFGYDLVRTVEPLGAPNPDPLGLPDLALMVPTLVLAFDHQQHELSIVVFPFDDTDPLELIGRVRSALNEPVPRMEASSGGDSRVHFESNLTQDEFEANVSRIVEYVRAGDAFQVVPSQRFSTPVPVEAFSIYRGLRTVNPSPYMYFLDFGDFQIAGASPEPLIKVSGRRVETRPIAGTYPRGSDEEEDRRNAEDLLADPKERAEHVMLVDLGRNDLGRVCEYGSVEVEELMVVETYSHVLHIVSRVAGRLRAEVGAMDALRACLPAGTLSGAPKVRAMEIIDELEPHKRCSYGGAIGYLGFDGDLDTAIHIRTVVVKDGVAHVQAGGGTVVDAKPEFEYRESVNKAKAVFRAVELAVSQPEWP
ncbi:MAG: anthranilate synthase component I [Actinomycetota bacterium]|nr:anthranilate synthase component I [Actinomycetota bacterium]